MLQVSLFAIGTCVHWVNFSLSQRRLTGCSEVSWFYGALKSVFFFGPYSSVPPLKSFVRDKMRQSEREREKILNQHHFPLALFDLLISSAAYEFPRQSMGRDPLFPFVTFHERTHYGFSFKRERERESTEEIYASIMHEFFFTDSNDSSNVRGMLKRCCCN